MHYLNSTYQAAATLLPNVFSVANKLSSPDDLTVGGGIVSLNPWTIFDKSWQAVMGYPTQDFHFVQGSTPMSTIKSAMVSILTYYLIVFGGRELMRDRPAFRLKTFMVVHNWYLTMISGGLLVLFLQELLPNLWRDGLFEGICGQNGWTQRLVVLYYLNYLTKYLELLDTVSLVLKKKPLTFLHTYHHGATALLCYTQLVGQTSVSWVPITLNLTVHVVMYWYFYQVALGNHVWWKEYITVLQITQFVLDIGFIYFASYNYYASTYHPWLPHLGTCGTKDAEVAAFAGCGLISSYLVLFVMFYLSTYRKGSKKRSQKEKIRKASKVEVPSVKDTADEARNALQSASNAIVEVIHDGQQTFA